MSDNNLNERLDQLSNSVDDLVESLEILTLLLDAALKKAAKEESDENV